MKTVALGEVAEFINGAAFKPEDWHTRGLPIIRIQNLTDPSKPINYTTRVVDDKYRVRRGDLLVSWSATLGVFKWDRTDEALVNQHIFRVVPDLRVVERSFLRHMLTSALTSMERHLHGATMKHVNRAEFLSTPIPLPPLAEQHRIAAILDHAGALRTKQREALHSLNQFGQATFQEMFDGTKPNARLGEYGEIQGGLQVTKAREGLPLSVSYLRVANVHRGRLEMSEVKTISVTSREEERTRLKPGDLLFVEGHANPREVGRVATWNGEIANCVHQNHLIRVRPDADRLDPVFAAAWFNSEAGAAHFRKSGNTTSGLNTISSSTVRAAPTVIPPIAEQRQFRQFVSHAKQRAQQMVETLGKFDELFASLQSRAFRGEL